MYTVLCVFARSISEKEYGVQNYEIRIRLTTVFHEAEIAIVDYLHKLQLAFNENH